MSVARARVEAGSGTGVEVLLEKCDFEEKSGTVTHEAPSFSVLLNENRWFSFRDTNNVCSNPSMIFLDHGFLLSTIDFRFNGTFFFVFLEIAITAPTPRMI